MSNLTVATIFVTCVNILMWMSTLSMLSFNPTGTFCYNLEGTIIDNTILSSGNYTVLDNDVINQLPTSEGTIVTPSDTAVSFTDVFKNIIGWFKSAPGLKYVYGVIAAPYNILKCMGLPVEFVAALGTFWYLVTFLILVAFIWGRN